MGDRNEPTITFFNIPGFAQVTAGVSQTSQVVVLTGNSTPSGNGKSLSFAPAINDAGQLSFLSFLSITTGGNDGNVGVFVWNGGVEKSDSWS